MASAVVTMLALGYSRLWNRVSVARPAADDGASFMHSSALAASEDRANTTARWGPHGHMCEDTTGQSAPAAQASARGGEQVTYEGGDVTFVHGARPGRECSVAEHEARHSSRKNDVRHGVGEHVRCWPCVHVRQPAPLARGHAHVDFYA